MPSLAKSDRATVDRAVAAARDRVHTAVQSRIDDLSRTCEDWAAWDSMYAFATDPAGNKKFQEENFVADTVASLGLSRVMLLDMNRDVVAVQDYDQVKAEAASFGWPRGVPGFIKSMDPSRESRGAMIGPDGLPSFYSFKSVRTGSKEGPYRGFLLMIRPLLTSDLEHIGTLTGATVAAPGVSTQTQLDETAGVPSTTLELTDAEGASVLAMKVAIDDRELRDAAASRDAILEQVGIALVLVWLASMVIVTGRERLRDLSELGPELAGDRTWLKPVFGMAVLSLGIAGGATLFSYRWERSQIDAEFRRRAVNFDSLMSAALRRELDEANVVAAAVMAAKADRDAAFTRMVESLVTEDRREGLVLVRCEGEERSLAAVSSLAPPVDYAALVREAHVVDVIRRTTDDGEPAMSGSVVMASDDGPMTLLVLAAPIYDAEKPRDLVAQRRAALRGVVLSVLDSRAALPQLLGGFRSGRTAWSVADERSETLAIGGEPSLLRSEAALHDDRDSEINVGGQLLHLRYVASADFVPGSGWLAPAVGVLGVTLAAMVTAMTAAFVRRASITAALVERRTAELRQANRELEDASIRAQSANRAKSEFLAHMSHEIRTPMTAILGYAELLEESLKDAGEKRDCVGTIRRSGEHLLTIINDILDFSKVEAGKMEIERVVCEPRAIAAEVESIMRVRATAKGLELRVEIDPSVPRGVQSDPTRLRQVLMNLVGNAIKFTNVGSVSLFASADVHGEACEIRFVVRDTGIGMEEAGLARLFQPFSQADSSMSRRFGGTGLGLAISRRLANLLGGDLSATSTPGVGSEFVFTFAASVAEVKESQHGVAPEAPHADGPRLAGRRVLVAEDGIDNQRLIRAFLTREGAEVTIVDNGKHAMEAAIAAREGGRAFDVVLMDVQMPIMDGYTATRSLRAAGYDGPVLALTAHALRSDYESSIAAGCNDHLTKPINKSKLIAACDLWSRSADINGRLAA
ncbi:MAG: ATP-binding protein [Planctomycetota bacterium]|nr:ATP-binding protein [Planctomycetota bacterium]